MTTMPQYANGTTFPWVMRTTSYHWWTHYTTYSLYFQNAINVDCNEFTWNILVDMNKLRQIFPNAKGSDIYLGENKCTGIEKNGHLTFQQGLDECLTSGRLQHGRNTYNNELIYAEHDPVYTFIIRHYNWTVNVECDVTSDGNGYGYVASGTSSPSPSLSSPQYPVNISYYADPNYMKEVSASPLHVAVGAQVYVKVFTETYDWNARMRVVSCYTKPTYNAPDHTKYYLLENGCEVDTNTHIISQSSHETKFVFDNFEYTSNHEGIYMFCDTIFCNTHDYSAKCRQSCNPVIRRKISVENVPSDDKEADKSSDVTNQDS
ncbi:CUB and zona pellucida-like domain-containing protein 1 [Ruditapes philippinarum]|uniref:CUB and zona pellucida-like domain-containing protein 1 n=1 Tax=Ruditapes philippinarum TaxID=129788 RepID=UPI00295BABFC|nr:CUB and zona pellucida-like domain-containing protein 1 [Ruditapes philippinarum]